MTEEEIANIYMNLKDVSLIKHQRLTFLVAESYKNLKKEKINDKKFKKVYVLKYKLFF